MAQSEGTLKVSLQPKTMFEGFLVIVEKPFL